MINQWASTHISTLPSHNPWNTSACCPRNGQSLAKILMHRSLWKDGSVKIESTTLHRSFTSSSRVSNMDTPTFLTLNVIYSSGFDRASESWRRRRGTPPWGPKAVTWRQRERSPLRNPKSTVTVNMLIYHIEGRQEKIQAPSCSLSIIHVTCSRVSADHSIKL